MPENEPLVGLAELTFILEVQSVFRVVVAGKVNQDGGGFHDGERGRLVVVDEDRDAAVGVEAEEPFLLLFVRGDVAK